VAAPSHVPEGQPPWPSPRTSTTPLTRKWDWFAEHTRTYLASGGTEGHESNGVHTVVLATTGRRTGEPRRTCVIYGTSGDDTLEA